ncbi:SEP-domain-containing protein [Corynespora cassiicola Philippines]|uniref:SEP-domain-containing protein n=1 Tax=Corynespora cassiicola Philippines TaxID=1448308 RepID=A0A2T2PCM4_CORCC|nr:SEP-domain-containing protein [Corynespora cassiicola Philippines]
MSSGAPANHDALVAELAGLTGVAPAEAERYLAAANWNIETAAQLYFEGAGDQDAAEQDLDMADDNAAQQNPTPNPPQQPQPGGGRTLGGAYVPPEASASSSRSASGARQPPQRGLRTLGDLQASSSGGHGHGHDDDHSDSDVHDDENQDFFAGGEKSGLAVQNPNQATPRDHINNILKRARQNAPRPGGDDDEPQTSRFTGTGMTLGGDDAPSRAIPDPNAAAVAPPPRAHRELHLWQDGFSVDDGPLFRYDDPANARTLEMINTGHAPLNILNVEHGQEVDVEVHAHKDEKYKQPKKKYVPFAGTGQRLGSPTPGASSTPPPPAAPAAAAAAAAAPSSTTPASGSGQQPSVTIDSSVPTVTLQIRLGDGTRLSSRFNTTHTVGDVYGFVNAASTTSQQRDYALMTTFPSKELTDKAQVLGDMAEFKRGGVVVQKWK